MGKDDFARENLERGPFLGLLGLGRVRSARARPIVLPSGENAPTSDLGVHTWGELGLSGYLYRVTIVFPFQYKYLNTLW